MKVRELFSRMDALGAPVSLRIGGRATHQTVYGAVLTLASLALTVWSSVGYLSGFSDLSKPSLVESSQESYAFPKMNLTEDGIAPTIMLMSKNKFVPAAQVGAFVTIRVISLLRDTADLAQPSKMTLLDGVVPCSQLSRDKVSRLYGYANVEDDSYRTGFAEFSSCIDPPAEWHFVQGRLSDNYRHTFRVTVTPCERKDCVDAKLMADLSIDIINPLLSFDPSDFARPVRSLPKFNPVFFVNPKSKTKYEYLLKRNLIYDSTGVFRTETLRMNYSTIDEVVSTVNVRDETVTRCIPGVACEPFLTIDYLSTGSSVKTIRVYRSLLETAASIGGVNKIISMVVGVVYAVVHYFSSKDLLVKGIFKADKQTLASYLRFVGLKEGASDPLTLRRAQKLFSSCAEAIIDHHLDVFTLVKEISRLRLLTGLLLPPSLLQVEPFISLAQEMRSRRARAKSRGQSATSVPDDSRRVVADESPSGRTFEQTAEQVLASGAARAWERTEPPGTSDKISGAIRGGCPDCGAGNSPQQGPTSVERCSFAYFERKLLESREAWREESSIAELHSRSTKQPPATSLFNSFEVAGADNSLVLDRQPPLVHGSKNRIIPKPR